MGFANMGRKSTLASRQLYDNAVPNVSDGSLLTITGNYTTNPETGALGAVAEREARSRATLAPTP